MPRKPARRPKPGVRALSLLVSRIGIRETARRLKVPQKRIEAWQKAGVPKTKLDTLTLVKKRHENARKAAKKTKLKRGVKALVKGLNRDAAYNSGLFDEIAEDTGLSTSEIYTIAIYSDGDSIAA